MTVMEQQATAGKVKSFLTQWGLKQKFVAERCQIQETAFSLFINGKLALSAKQLERVVAYIDDYVRRNS